MKPSIRGQSEPAVTWSFTIAFGGLVHLLRNEDSINRNRQFLYSGIFIAALLVYQLSYMVGIAQVTELDTPTTVAVFFLIFLLAAQKERLFGASLLNRPVFHNSPYGIEILDENATPVFQNKTMDTVRNSTQIKYRMHNYSVRGGKALIYEDISALVEFEQTLKESREKLIRARSILSFQAEQTGHEASQIERENFSQNMEELFYRKIEDVKILLVSAIANAKPINRKTLSHLRFLISICQNRLRFILKYPRNKQLIPIELISNYASKLIMDGGQWGLDGVFINNAQYPVTHVQAQALLEQIDSILLEALQNPGESLVMRLFDNEKQLSLTGIITREAGDEDKAIRIIFPERGDNYVFV